MFKLQRTEGAILQPIPEHPWESGAVFNPAVIADSDALHMLYRAVEAENFSTVGYARLDKSGRVVYRHSAPLITREHEYEKQGVEDPRIARIDGRYYIVYTGYDAAACRVCMASTSDFASVQKHGVIIPDIWDKDAMLFPEPVNGKLILMHRIEPSIQLAQFDGIDHLIEATATYWERHFANLDDHTIMRPLYAWEAEKIGGGAPPIKTSEGWLVIYHGVDRKSIYRAGAALLDLDNPFRVIARLPQSILEPEQDYEKRGDVPNVVFPEGALVDGNRLMVFYGGADKVIGLAVAELDELLHELQQHRI